MADLRRNEVLTEEDDPNRFATRIDNWLLAILAGVGIISVASVLLSASQDSEAAVVSAVLLTFTFGLVFALAVPTHYTVTDQELKIRSGVIQYRIPLDSIQRVYPTRNPLAAPAWSIDRLGVEYKRGKRKSLALISPARREQFLELLMERTALKREGEELRRGDSGRI